MIGTQVAEATQEAAGWWVAPGIIAAVIAASVALITLVVQTRRSRLDRQRELFADAFADVSAYHEFPYVIRRRHNDGEDRLRITNDFSAVQRSINKHRAILRVESAHVSAAFEALVTATRTIAGGAARDGWEQPVRGADVHPNVDDVDLSGIEPAQGEYLQAVSDHLSVWPVWLRRNARKLFNRKG
jgi:hypothetical protein